MDYSTLMLRWVHILAASIAVGSLFYSRFAILPAIEEALDEASQVRMSCGGESWARAERPEEPRGQGV